MTEQENNNGMNISVEQILAAIVATAGDVTIQIDDLVKNYGNKMISVSQNEDKSVTFSLVDAVAPAAEESAE